MRVLLIDHYDSFTYNLAQYVLSLGAELIVREHDRISLQEARGIAPTHLLLGPGPGSPERAADLGATGELILGLAPRTPTLGVCLGQQAIALALGGRIGRAQEVRHGKTSEVSHDGQGLFRGLPNPMTAMRYHSLVVLADSLPAELQVVAHSQDPVPVVMALRHREWPLYGVQFHPESVGTPDGRALIANFLAR